MLEFDWVILFAILLACLLFDTTKDIVAALNDRLFVHQACEFSILLDLLADIRLFLAVLEDAARDGRL